MVKVFRIVSWVEWVSYMLLLVAVVYKKGFNGDALIVSYLGRAHGFLFVVYIILAFLVKVKLKLSFKNFFMLCIMSVLPFGVFLIHRFLKE